MKKILLFDIDRTIFDTDKLLRLQYEIISKIVNAKNFKDFWDSTLTKEKHVTSEERLDLICSKYEIGDSKILFNVYYEKEYEYMYRDSVYSEVRDIFNKLKEKYRLGIYSEGTVKYQNHKFKSMGISNYFEKELIFIVPTKDTLEVIQKLPKGAVVVDDKEIICEFLTENNIKAIWLNKKDDRKSERFETIHNLLELPGVL